MAGWKQDAEDQSPGKALIMVRPFGFLDLESKLRSQESSHFESSQERSLLFNRIKPGLRNGENKNCIILGRLDYFAKLTFHRRAACNSNSSWDSFGSHQQSNAPFPIQHSQNEKRVLFKTHLTDDLLCILLTSLYLLALERYETVLSFLGINSQLSPVEI